MFRTSLIVLALATLATTGCKKKEGEGGKPSSTEAAKAAGPTKLPTLGLQIDVPGSVEVGKAIGGEGHMLQGSGIGAMTIELATKPQTVDEAKSDAEMYSPKDLKTEALSDGWAMSFENKGGMGTNYFVDVRRDIEGKSYKCSTTGSEKSQAAAVLAACKTLRK